LRTADYVENAIFNACKTLTPFLPVRFWTVTRFPNFLLVYRPETKPLQVVAILHGRRELGLSLIDTESDL
jgi:hypothetical protein